MNDLLLIKLLFILIYTFFYYKLYQKVNYLEEKIIFWYFFTFLFIGGSITALIYDYTDLIFTSSGMKMIKTDMITWLIFFIISFLIPYICLYIFKKIMYKNNEPIVYSQSHSFILVFMTLITLLYVYLNIDIGKLISLFDSIKSYSSWIIYRNQLEYSSVFYFMAKSLSFVLLLSLSFELYFRNKKIYSFIVFFICLIIFGLIEHFLFATKGLMFNFAIGYLILIFLNVKVRKFLLLGFLFLLIYVGYYAYNMGVTSNYELNNVFTPIISGLTRFTLNIPAFIEYYMVHDFDMRIYFNSVLAGENIISPKIKVYDMLFDNTIDLGGGVYGSLTNSMFTFNYSNFGIFAIPKSMFEFFILIWLYKYFIVKDTMTSVKLAILILLLFNILNFEFITILVNPVVGLIVFVLFYFLKDTVIPQILFRKKVKSGEVGL